VVGYLAVGPDAELWQGEEACAGPRAADERPREAPPGPGERA